MTISTSRKSRIHASRHGSTLGPRRPDIRTLFWALAAALLLIGPAPPAFGQQVSDEDASAPIVTRVEFSGNVFFSDDDLALRVRTQPNRRFLGIPGVTWWLWLYRFGDSGALGRRVGDALMAGGEPPAYFDRSVLEADLERLRLLYLQEGYRNAEVDAVVDSVGQGKVRVSFVIQPGSPTYMRDVTFEGLDLLTSDQRSRMVQGTLLNVAETSPDRPLTFRTANQRYSEPTLLEERRRLLAFLRDEGFAAVSRDSIRALIYPQSPDSFDVTFRIRTGPRFRFGDVHFVATGPEPPSGIRRDTLSLAPVQDDVPGGIATVSVEGERKLSQGLLLRTLQFRPGEWYSQSRVMDTKRRLEGTGVFQFTDVSPIPADTGRVASDPAPRLPHRIELRTRSRHQIRLETFMLQRTGVLASPDAELGTGVGITYENVNLLGRGETFRVRSTGSLAADIDSTFFTAAQAEIVTSLTYPYLVGPFRRLESALGLYDARTRLSLSLLTARQDKFYLVIRGRGNARYRLELRHAPTVTSLVDVIDVSVSSPDTLSNFRSEVLEKWLLRAVTDPVQQAQILEDYTVPQVNTALRYTLRSANVNPLRRERGYSYEAAVEIGNNLPLLLDRFVFSPGNVEGSLPGIPIFTRRGTPSRLVYRPYVRFVGDLRRYKVVAPGSVLAVKFIGGIAHPTGQARVVPFDRRFHSGGASSVRGWGLRELGPGAAGFTAVRDTNGRSPATGEFANILGGDLKLEAGVELRNTLLHSVLAADWIAVLFADAGNVWFGPRNPAFGGDVPEGGDGRFRLNTFYREFGVGTGIGLRAAWEYLILRLDLGVKVYDPRRSGAGIFPDGLRDIQPHFGIGHAF